MFIRKKTKIQDILSDRIQLKESPYDIEHKSFVEEADSDKYEAVKLPPALIVLCGDPSLCPYTGSFLTSLACCAENMLLASHVLGLGSCWLYVYDPDTPETEMELKVRIGIPERFTILCLIPVGYPGCDPGVKEIRRDAVHWDIYK